MAMQSTSDHWDKASRILQQLKHIVVFICIRYTNRYYITLYSIMMYCIYGCVISNMIGFIVLISLAERIYDSSTSTANISSDCIDDHGNIILNKKLCGPQLFEKEYITMHDRSCADIHYYDKSQQSLNSTIHKNIISAPLPAPMCSGNCGNAPTQNGNGTDGNDDNNNNQQTEQQNDGDDGSPSNSSGNTGCPGGNDNNKRNGNNDNNDDHNKKEPNDADENNDNDNDTDTEEEKEKRFRKSNSKTSGLDPNAVEWDVSTRTDCIGAKMKTIDENIPFGSKNSKSIHPLGPGKIRISYTLTDKGGIITNSVRETLYNNYDYMNKSLIFKSIIYYNDRVCVINYGFHDKETNNLLYCVAVKDASNNKYEWDMKDTLYAMDEIIESEYHITHNLLPAPISCDAPFSERIKRIKHDMDMISNTNTMHNILLQTKWSTIAIYPKRNCNEQKTLRLSQNEFKRRIQECNESNITNMKLIPIIKTNPKNDYWMECVWIVRIYSHMDIGISLQYDRVHKRIKVTGIHLSKDYLCKSHQLMPSSLHNWQCFDEFLSFYGGFIIGNIDLNKENSRLKKQMQELKLQNAQFKQFILRVSNCEDVDGYDVLKQEAVRVLNAVTPAAVPMDEKCYDTEHEMVHIQTEQTQPHIMEKPKETMQYTIPQTALYPSFYNMTNTPISINMTSLYQPSLITSPITSSSIHLPSGPLYPIAQPQLTQPPIFLSSMYNITQPQLSQLSVQASSISDYSLNLSQTSWFKCFPECDAKCIQIEKSFTRDYLEKTKIRFKNSKILYYYLKQTITMQINDKFARIYDDTYGIIHCDLLDRNSGKVLYAVIERTHHQRKGNKKWKVVTLSTFPAISCNYNLNIAQNQLPRSSRSKDTFKKQLKQREHVHSRIYECIDDIAIANKHRVKSKARDRKVAYTEEIKITEDHLRECIKQSNMIVPIVKIKDKHHCHWIEWVVICEIHAHIDKRLNFGVSFRCSDGKVEATSIFLDGAEIERQNLLTNSEYYWFDATSFVSAINKLHIIKSDA